MRKKVGNLCVVDKKKSCAFALDCFFLHFYFLYFFHFILLFVYASYAHIYVYFMLTYIYIYDLCMHFNTQQNEFIVQIL